MAEAASTVTIDTADDTANGGSGAEVGVTKSKDLWFDDGNIVIQAESTVFKVHRSILALNSAVFKDMFAVAQPEDGEQFADCPLVNVQDESDAMSHFLKAMYIPGYTEAITDFLQIASVAYPPNTAPQVLHPDKLLTLAQECNLRIFLPATMNQLCLLGHDYMIDHVPAREDIKLCLAGRQTIIDAWRKLVGLPPLAPEDRSLLLFRSSRSDCCQQQTRDLTMVPGIFAIMSDSKIHVHDAEAIKKISSAAWQKLCVDCASTLRRNVERARQSIWNDLPGMFGLPPWTELRKETGDEGNFD
ncbi:hypothetical protein OE88DRAFT_1732693 [Heliocybe sulcata]|uniref:BTB domain-containing protein n=1 Tax=Heliocybe sulcata TaxID=5364 RepID=A0A5C3N890_9AGAM|nr:hypothetical protein OE88DRAFT_1732693 [Heliocybe sulcata]